MSDPPCPDQRAPAERTTPARSGSSAAARPPASPASVPAARGGQAGARAAYKRRPISPRSPLEGRQLWRIGDWGGASEAIGRQWEAFGARALRDAVLQHPRPGPAGTNYVPRAAVVISDDPTLAQAVHRHGKAHADALLVGPMDGQVVLEPVDFKWTLETAEPRQVGVAVLEALLEAPPAPLREALAAALASAGADPSAPLSFHQGMFLAPDHRDNRAQLEPLGPLPRDLAVLCAVEAREFFPPLPGWDVALALARQDGAYLERVESAERYYRLGAGVLGALRKLRAGLFAEDLPELDGAAALAELKRSRGLRQVGDVVAYLDRALLARAELAERLRQVEHQTYPFNRYRADVAARGLGRDEGDRRRWERLYGEIMKVVGRAVRREGRALVAQGHTELEALGVLATRAEFARLACELLDERLRT